MTKLNAVHVILQPEEENTDETISSLMPIRIITTIIMKNSEEVTDKE